MMFCGVCKCVSACTQDQMFRVFGSVHVAGDMASAGKGQAFYLGSATLDIFFFFPEMKGNVT